MKIIDRKTSKIVIPADPVWWYGTGAGIQWKAIFLYWMPVATDFLGNCSRRYSTSYIHVVVSFRDITHILWAVFIGTTLKRLNQMILITTLTLCMSSMNAFADELGRLFTTPQERAALEKLRHQEPVKEIKTEITFEEPEVEEVKPDIGGITVDGLVYRKNGKSTAWINNSNTYEGDFSNQYLRINTGNIEPGNVQVEIPGSVNNIKLKVGQTYDPNAEKVTDLTE